ncbi:MAG TPA: hypothetical protein PKM73_18575 [Verrucomicrobiota bacterium]|nr:hypothetical protein [Verrucomicrobiota bacterium]HNU52913.1 hypothetical protein [Verrucomicrobiota bacterium]
MKTSPGRMRACRRAGGFLCLGMAALAWLGAGCSTWGDGEALLARERELLARSWNDSALPGECLLQPAPLSAQPSTREATVPDTTRGYVASRDLWGPWLSEPARYR